MTCPNCGTINMDGSSFCIKCGSNLKIVNQPNYDNQIPVQSEQYVNNQYNGQNAYAQTQNYYQSQTNNVFNGTNYANTESLNYFSYIIAFFLKPFQSYKNEENKFNNTKNSLIFSLIVAVIMMISKLLQTIINTVFYQTVDYSTYKLKTAVDFGRLKYIKWFDLIGKNLLVYALIIAGIVLVYYIISLLFRKKINYIKTLSITATSLIPFAIGGILISRILIRIWMPLYYIVLVASALYTVLIFINLMNDELNFDDADTKIYFHLLSLTIAICGGGYIYYKVVLNAIGGLLG